MRSLGNSVPVILLAWTILFSMLAILGVGISGRTRMLVFLVPALAPWAIAGLFWLVVRTHRIELAGGELRVPGLLSALDLVAPLTELAIAANGRGWVFVLHGTGNVRQVPLLFPDGIHFQAAMHLMCSAQMSPASQ